MPSTATITAFYNFSAQTVIRSAQVNSNFDAIRGHIIPIDPSTLTSAATKTYDLGSDEHRWRNVYGKVVSSFVSTTGSMTLSANHDLVLLDPTSATITATLPAVATNTGTSFVISNIGTANTVLIDANASETINNTLTVNIVNEQSVKLFCTGVLWRII